MPSQYETYLRRYLNDNGKLWSSEQIERWAIRAEQEICRVTPSVTIRSQLAIQRGLPLYTIPPDYIATQKSFGINQITYKGNVLTPFSLSQARDYFPHAVIENPGGLLSGAFNAAAFNNNAFYVSRVWDDSGIETGRPEYWWYAGYNENQIQLYPTPNEEIAYDSMASEDKLWGASIKDLVIVEYRTYSAGQKKPLYRLIRQLIKDYVLSMAFSIEGKGQQMREATMLKKRFETRMNLYRTLADNVFVANKNAFDNQFQSNYSPFKQLNYGNDIGIRIR